MPTLTSILTETTKAKMTAKMLKMMATSVRMTTMAMTVIDRPSRATHRDLDLVQNQDRSQGHDRVVQIRIVLDRDQEAVADQVNIICYQHNSILSA